MNNDKRITIEKKSFNKDTGTILYDIQNIDNWDLEHLWRLLKAEDARARIVRGFNRGISELKIVLDGLAKERGWTIEPEQS